MSTSSLSLGTDEFHIPPASVGTVPELADWRKEHAPYGSNGNSSGSTEGSGSHTSLAESQDTLKETSDGEASLGHHSSASCAGGPHQAFLFPVSNSPMDLVTMLVRLASFTGTLLGVLIPKLKSTTLTAGKVGWLVGFVCMYVYCCTALITCTKYCYPPSPPLPACE